MFSNRLSSVFALALVVASTSFAFDAVAKSRGAPRAVAEASRHATALATATAPAPSPITLAMRGPSGRFADVPVPLVEIVPLPEWVIQIPERHESPSAPLVFIDAAAQRPVDAATPVVERRILRSYDMHEGTALGLAHRSISQRWRVDCQLRAVALTEWTLHAGAMGGDEIVHGGVVTADLYAQPDVRSPEGRLVRETCAP